MGEASPAQLFDEQPTDRVTRRCCGEPGPPVAHLVHPGSEVVGFEGSPEAPCTQPITVNYYTPDGDDWMVTGRGSPVRAATHSAKGGPA